MLLNSIKKSILVPSAIALVCFIIYCTIDANFNTYESDFITREAFYPIEFVMVIGNSLVIAVLSLTILLNHYNMVKSNGVLSLFALFLCPLAWIGVILIQSNPYLLAFSKGLDSPAIFVFINTLPYIVTSVLLFIQFRRGLKTTELVQ